MKIEEMIAVNRADCSGCEACANVCPRNAITMIRDAEGFAYPKINRELCSKCGRCDRTCPALNFTAKTLDALPKTFAAINPDEKIRRHSSSGGVFSALAEIILRGGGVVFGASFDEKFHVRHTCARTLDELENLRGSKYVQSQIGDVYRQVADALQSGSVLFSGTPCQCAGLKHFLGSEPENLLTVSVICHGAPSPALWENYIGEIAHSNEVAHVNFRSKRNGWAVSHVEINFFDRGYYLRPLSQDLYGKLFLRGLSERPSCRACKFKIPNGQSDLILGDAWGLRKFAPEMFDNRGTSLVIVQTAKGADFFERLNVIKLPVKFFDAVINNPNSIMPEVADERRDNFFADLSKTDDIISVMQKFYQDDDTARQIKEQNRRALLRRCQVLAAQVRNHFERNILVIATTLAEHAKKFFERNFPNCGVYLIQFHDTGAVTCTENFSSLSFRPKNNFSLPELVNQLSIDEICVEGALKFKSIAVAEWLETCGLPVKTFSVSND